MSDAIWDQMRSDFEVLLGGLKTSHERMNGIQSETRELARKVDHLADEMGEVAVTMYKMMAATQRLQGSFEAAVNAQKERDAAMDARLSALEEWRRSFPAA